MPCHLPRRGAAALLAAALLPACTVQVGERELLQPIRGGSLAQEAVAKLAPAYALTRHDVVAPDGARLHAVLLRQPGARGTILYFGGNGYTIERFGAMTAAWFEPLGVDLMLIDHRGYGPSEGVPSAAAMEADGLAAFDWLARLPGQDPARIVVHGQSLGSFIAGHVAGRRAAGGVVLESSVTTTEDWVAAQTKGKPIKVRINESLRGRGNLGEMARIEEPLLLLVGSADRTTPPRLSRALHDASPLPPERKTLHVAAGANHVDVMEKADTIAAYRRFLATVLP